MALDWTGDEPKKEEPVVDKRLGYYFDEVGYFRRELLTGWPKGVNTFIPTWEPTPEKVDTAVTISISQGKVSESLQIKPEELLPKNRFKLHQKD